MADGTATDIKTIMKFLACYVDGSFRPSQFIVTGVSLGGHVAWNMLSEEPSIIGAIIIIGSPNLTDLLKERLDQTPSFSNLQRSERWPRSLEMLCRDRDQAIARISGQGILILNGALDTLVPSKFTTPWFVNHASRNEVKLVSQEDSGHWLSFGMMEEVIDWLVYTL